MTEVKADEVSLVDDLSDHAAAPTAAGTVPSLTTAAQAVIHGEISPMLLEACHAAAEAEFGTAVDDVDQVSPIFLVVGGLHGVRFDGAVFPQFLIVSLRTL